MASSADIAAVAELLGRHPQGDFEVVVRHDDGSPRVIRNQPILDTGQPMPTLYWLVSATDRLVVSRLESSGAVSEAEAAVEPEALIEAHNAYAAERDALIARDYTGHRPSAGVGGTRVGVKCLHAHYAYYLAGGEDPVGRWVAARLAENDAAPSTVSTDAQTSVAVIELGSHSTRLLIDRGGESIERHVTLTRMAEGMGSSKRKLLQPAAIDRVCAAVERYKTLVDANNVTAIRAVATSAARDAANSDVLCERVEAIAGVALEILDGEAEARLTFSGAVAGLDPTLAPFLVVDIGGGSTEFAFGASDCEDSISLDVGSVRLTEKYIESDPPLPEELSACVTVTGAWLDDVDRELPVAHSARTVIGVGGTISTAAAVELGIAEYKRESLHHFELSSAAAEDVFRTLATENRDDRSWNPGLPAERVDTIVGGLCILVKVMRHFDLEHIMVSEADILDGVIASLR